MSSVGDEMTLIVIAKAPVAGRVKTRLCPPATPEEAASLAMASLIDTCAAVSATPARRRLIALDGDPGPWLPTGFDVVAQPAGGLDVRLAAAFDAAGGPALLVGMDTPQITQEILTHAVGLLTTRGTGAVLGPAADGGWWAIGLRHPDPAVFLGVPMSTDRTGALQWDRLVTRGLHPRRLGQLRDVDDYDDAGAVAAGAPTTLFSRCFSVLDDARRLTRTQT